MVFCGALSTLRVPKVVQAALPEAWFEGVELPPHPASATLNITTPPATTPDQSSLFLNMPFSPCLLSNLSMVTQITGKWADRPDRDGRTAGQSFWPETTGACA